MGKNLKQLRKLKEQKHVKELEDLAFTTAWAVMQGNDKTFVNTALRLRIKMFDLDEAKTVAFNKSKKYLGEYIEKEIKSLGPVSKDYLNFVKYMVFDSGIQVVDHEEFVKSAPEGAEGVYALAYVK